MSSELQAFALKNVLIEIKNACPDVSHTFIFGKNNTIVARDEVTEEQVAIQTAEVLNALSKKTETLGALESATFYGVNNHVSVCQVMGNYLTLISSEEIDEKSCALFARILIPTSLKLTEKIYDSSQQENVGKKSKSPKEPTSNTTKHSHSEESRTDISAEEVTVEVEAVEEHTVAESNIEMLPEAPATQFLVEDVGRWHMTQDTVNIDSLLVHQWQELYGDKEISEVELETLNGKTMRCKFKIIKDSKQEGKGTIQLPPKIQRTINISKGELITLKPVIDQ